MYSAGSGETALDNLPGDPPSETNSVYTRELVPLLLSEGLPLNTIAIRVRKRVAALAKTADHAQNPAYYDGLTEEACLWERCLGYRSAIATGKPSNGMPR